MSKREYEQEINELIADKVNLFKQPHLYNLLVQYYTPLVKQICAGFRHKKPHLLDYDDLIAAGHMGLLDAINKFNPEKGVQFRTYATIRIRGSVIDEINKSDWTPRSVRENIKSVIRAIESHSSEHGEEPSVEQVGEAALLDNTETRKVLGQMEKTYIANFSNEDMEFAGPRSNFDEDNKNHIINIMIEQNLDEYQKDFILLKFHMGYNHKEIMKIMHINQKELNEIRDSAYAILKRALKD